MGFIGQQLVSKGQGCVDCCCSLTTGSSSSCVVFTSCLLAVLSSFKFFPSNCNGMGAPGRLVGICQPLAGGCVFGLAEQSGSLLWVLDGEMGSIPVTEKLHAYPPLTQN